MKLSALVRASLLAAALAGCSTPSGRYPALSADTVSPYRLDAGDEVRVTIYGLDPVNANYAVSDQGTISLPLVATIRVAGKTVSEVEAALTQALLAKDIVKRPSVSVEVTKYRPFFILGEVQRPGQYAYVPGMTVMNAVSIAGGYTFRAKKGRVLINRRTSTGMVKGSARPETPVMPGDSIQVDESWF